MAYALKNFFEPQGVAIVGASENPDKLSYGILKNMLEYGYSGRVYPVNPKAEKILGLKSYAEILDVPDPVDLAVIILPAPLIPGIIEACGKRGIKNVTVISGGFKEIGPEGKDLENRILEIARSYEMRLIGPNCVGTMNLNTGLNTTFIKGIPAKGGIGFISQSGAVCGGVVDHVINQGIGFSHLLSLGNEADVDETDMIEYLGNDSETNVIAAYIEGIQDGQRFLRISKNVAAAKPIVVLKAGRSEQGAKAVSSHTGTLAGSHEAYRAAFRQIGAVEVKSTEELLNVAMALDWVALPKGNRAVIVTNSGGPAALASDSLAEYGLTLAELSGNAKEKLREMLNPSAQVDNPVDMLGGADEVEYAHALKHSLADEDVDMGIAVLVPQALVNPVNVAKAIIRAAKESEKPLIACLMGSASIQEARQLLHMNRVPMVDFPEMTGPMLGALYSRILHAADRSQMSQNGTVSTPDKELVERLLAENNGQRVWGEYETRPILEAYGIPLIEARFAQNFEEASKTAQEIGYPLALKVVSPDVLHKSDAGGIEIGLVDENDLEEAVEKIRANVTAKQPDAHIKGFLVEKMAPAGQEVIVGMKRDRSFGPLMMFGMGGIFVELFKDVSFRVAPLIDKDAVKMVRETRAYQLLSGWRGGPAYDIHAVADVLMRLGSLVTDFPEIAEIEINPLIVFQDARGAVCIDCRMILGE